MAGHRNRTAPGHVLRAAVAALAFASALPRAGGIPSLAVAAAEEDWFVEFEAICSRTQDAMSIPDGELRALVSRCDRLKPKIEALDPSRRKVYTKRLQQCRDVYQFVLDTRTQG
jgi:hypothetical protein